MSQTPAASNSQDHAFQLFAGGVAHDFSNFLTIISGFSQLLKAQRANDAELAESLQEILVACERAGVMIEQLAVLSGQRPMRLNRVSLTAAVQGMIAPLQARAGDGLTIAWTACANPVELDVDAGRLQEALGLVIDQARAELSGGGTVRMGLEPVRLAQPMAGLPPGAYARLQIQLTGSPLIDPKALAGAFDPFFLKTQTKRGHGLGLAVAQAIALQHRGRITAESAQGTGTTFNIYLPTV